MIARIPEREGYSYPDQHWDDMGIDTFVYIDIPLRQTSDPRGTDQSRGITEEEGTVAR